MLTIFGSQIRNHQFVPGHGTKPGHKQFNIKEMIILEVH